MTDEHLNNDVPEEEKQDTVPVPEVEETKAEEQEEAAKEAVTPEPDGVPSWLDEIAEEFKTIPKRTTADYLVVKVAPSKGKTELDNKMATLIMTSYADKDGNAVKTVSVGKEPDGSLLVDFPNGKKGLKATMFSGKYEFRFPQGDKWFTVTEDKFTESYFVSKVLPKIQGSDKFTEEEVRQQYADYLDDLFNYKLSNEFNLTNEQVSVGMVTKFIRTYTPPDKEKDEKYGNTRLSKWDGEAEERITGDYQKLPFDVVEAIVQAYESDDKDPDMPF